jgi:hypothetical protein
MEYQNKEELLYKELKKCMMVCSNYHRIINLGGD